MAVTSQFCEDDISFPKFCWSLGRSLYPSFTAYKIKMLLFQHSEYHGKKGPDKPAARHRALQLPPTQFRQPDDISEKMTENVTIHRGSLRVDCLE